jgi:hypothetical protein
MKKRYNGEDGSEVDAMEAADKAYRANKPPLKEMGDAGAAEEAGQFGDAGSSRTVKATPKAMPKAMPKAASKPAAKAESKPAPKAAAASDDVTKMSLADRAKRSRESARAGSGATDTRSVGERLRSALAGKDRGGNTVDFGGTGMGMKRGGSVMPSKMGGVKTAKPSFGSASKRADGIASKGKTRGKFI